MKTIKILHLFPKLLSLYGEYGNVKVLVSTLRKGGWEVIVDSLEEVPGEFAGYNLVYLGSGTEDNLAVAAERMASHAEAVESSMKNGTLWLATGNAMALFGAALTRDGAILPTLGCFGYQSEIQKGRYLGDVLTEADETGKQSLGFVNTSLVITGVEHPLLTFKLGANLGNDKKSPADGVKEEGFLATQLIGPFLVKNPHYLGLVYEAITGYAMPVEEESFIQKAYAVSLGELQGRLNQNG